MIAEKDFAGRQTRGSRGHQEDAYAFSDILGAEKRVEGLLVVVADGMGGHTSGDEASELALESFIEAFHNAGGLLRDRLRTAALAANDAIAQELKRSPQLEGMGTTLLAAGITNSGAEWISIGDSPLYLWRDNNLKRLNEDHSFRPMLHDMVETGELAPADLARHPLRNLLRAALTGDEIELIDQPAQPFALKAGDLILAATDGIQTLKDDAIAAAMAKAASADASTVASSLLQTLLEAANPRQDNATVAIIKAAPEGFVAHAPLPPTPESETNTETVTIIISPSRR